MVELAPVEIYPRVLEVGGSNGPSAVADLDPTRVAGVGPSSTCECFSENLSPCVIVRPKGSAQVPQAQLYPREQGSTELQVPHTHHSSPLLGHT